MGTQTTVLAWHFLEDGKLRDGTKPPRKGAWLRHTGDLELCTSGLHASTDIMDALKYAPGGTLCRVECGGEVIESDDKRVCSQRKILWRFDATETMREFARWCALQVIDLWDAPDVVRNYLETGDEDLRAAAGAAARDAAGAAAWAAARAAAGDARAAAGDAQCTHLLTLIERDSGEAI